MSKTVFIKMLKNVGMTVPKASVVYACMQQDGMWACKSNMRNPLIKGGQMKMEELEQFHMCHYSSYCPLESLIMYKNTQAMLSCTKTNRPCFVSKRVYGYRF